VPEPRRLWLDLGGFGGLRGDHPPGAIDAFWQDHGLALLRTIMHEAGVMTDLASTRTMTSWQELWPLMLGYDQLLMNVRSYRMGQAAEAARGFKELNPDGKVLVGGMHATVSPEDMEACPDFDHICTGPGEGVIVDLARDPGAFPRIFPGPASKSMADWPRLDRTLWPRPVEPSPQAATWPLEASCGWGPPPVATVITSRVCPFKCSFCNELSYVPQMERRSVDQTIDDLNDLDERHGPLGSFVIHDSLWFQQRSWLDEWLEKFPKRARRVWPYWAAARADLVRKWPDLFEALVRKTNWTTVSIGFESGSTQVLQTLNKECTAEDNAFCIDLLNRIGDDLEAQGRIRPRFWTNIMFAVPGETKEQSFETMRMLRSIKNPIPTIAYYAPFPGSALGYQLIAEGKSLMAHGDHQRYAGQPKVKGIDYDWYSRLLRGDFDAEVRRKSWP
jgi:radical SAM superfamily enzyme YgiQ (UPF0313 family)